MKIGSLILLFVVATFLQVQGQMPEEAESKGGVNFEHEKSWGEVLELAKRNNKLVFVDFYASWCTPCKMMDRSVYSNQQVGSFANKHYISIKMQIDSGVYDNPSVKGLRPIAKNLVSQYKIQTLPTYIIFSPEGLPLHRDAGVKEINNFISFLQDGNNPAKQIYTQVNAYHSGTLDPSLMGELAVKILMILQNNLLASEMGEKYITRYLANLDDEVLLRKENISFIASWPKLLNSNNKYFRLFLANGKLIDSIMENPNLAQKTVDFVVSKEEIWDKGKDPDWNKCERTIKAKYGSRLAARVILDAEQKYFIERKNWTNAINIFYKKYDRFGLDSSFFGLMGANNFLYDVALPHAKSRKIINTGLKIAEHILTIDSLRADYIDTYANLLYQAGRKSEAVYWQKKAVILDPENPEKVATLNKMKNADVLWK